MTRPKEPRGYRRKRLIGTEPEPLNELHSKQALVEGILGTDAVADIVRQAAARSPLPEPEDLLVSWAQQYYQGGGDFFVWQIGFYVAEDLKLRGLVRDER